MIALDPSKTTWLQLPEDKGKPDAPAFKVRFATCRQMDQFFDLLDEAKTGKDSRADSGKLTQALEMFVVGWRNMPDGVGEFGPGKLDDVLTWVEKWNLAWEYPSAVTIAESEIKKSESPLQSAGVASAPAAPADAK